MNFAAVCERAVMIIGRAIDGSHGTYAVVAPFGSLPKIDVWLALYDGVRMSSGEESVQIEMAYLCPRGVVRVIYDDISARFSNPWLFVVPREMTPE